MSNVLAHGEKLLGLMDRDWYWQRRARRNSPDDDYLFPNHRWPGRKSTVYPTALAILAVLALLVFGLHQGWFDGDWRSHAAKVDAETKALRAWESEHRPDRPPTVATPHAARHVATIYEKNHVSIDFALVGLTMLSPFVLFGVVVGVFFGRLRGPSLMGLVLGIVAANVGGILYLGGALFRWGLLDPADSMGGAFQFLMVILASFTSAAIAGAIAVFVLRRTDLPSDVTAIPTRESDDRSFQSRDRP